jgi:hypothetical protein
MNKKIYTEGNSKFNYHLNRTCKNCGAPISDHEHTTREFCPIIHNDNGKVRDCKTAYHRQNDKADRERYAQLIANHKAITSRIEFLISKKGYEVATDDLNVYEITLDDSVRYSINPDNGTITSVFLKHTIVSNPITNIHKITYHDKQ